LTASRISMLVLLALYLITVVYHKSSDKSYKKLLLFL
jgi:hypothetical protein